MSAAIFTREMMTKHQHRKCAFTLIELLVVIAIIIVVAGLVVGLAGVAGEKGKISRAEAERDRLVTLIHHYKSKLGVYPPDNTDNPGHNTLLYELAGAIRDTNNTPANPTYLTPFGNVSANVLSASFTPTRRGGIVNAVDIGGETNAVVRLLRTVRPDQKAAVVNDSLSLVVPINDWDKQRPNPWNYLAGDNAQHNKDSFDLWVNIRMGAKTNVIGNWRN